ncbi:PP2C family protein-serine/threonine phosphatase [Porticoccus sp.]|nr:MAG: fused response regulator/phosphatase [Gammaproteobacteria bacterium]
MEINGKLYIVADNQDDCHELQDLLVGTPWQVSCFDDTTAAVNAIQVDHPAVVVINLPFSDLQDQLLALASLDLDVAYIMVLPEIDPRQVVELFHQNVSDVVIRPFTGDRFREAVKRASGCKSLLVQNRQYREQLEKANRELEESLRILEIDQMAGRQVQHSLLPVTPLRHGDYEIAHRIVPSLFLSGDFVGYNVVFDRYMVLYVADVSGHGASSAFLTVLLKFILNRILRRHISLNDHEAMAKAPLGFIEHINRQIMALGLDKHLTLFSASIDMEQNILRYSVAAHMPTPVFFSEGDVRTLPGKGKPVGIFENATWEVQEIMLPEKFAMVIVSDGVLEFLPAKSYREKEQYLADTVAHSDTSMESICEGLGINEVGDVPDDVTVLTIRRGF